MRGDGDDDHSPLVVLTTNPTDAGEVTALLQEQLTAGAVARCAGYYAAIPVLQTGARVVVVDVGSPRRHEAWRLADLRAHAPEASVVVVADATLLQPIAGAVGADLAVTSVAALPPLRELLLGPAASTVAPQTSRRRSTR
jgi:hypothetical protein